MANENTPAADLSADLAAADSAAENLLRRSRESSIIEVDPAREAALDEAFNSIVPPTDTEEPLGRENDGVKQKLPGTPEEKPAPIVEEKPAPAEKPAPETKPEPAPAEKPARKGLLDDLIDDPAPKVEDTPEKAYEDIKLRSDASPKTQETFNAVKTRALERESAVRVELEAQKKRALELEAKLTEFEKQKGALPEEIAQELKDHREFRALHDVSSRPEFKEKYDARIDANYESVYALFKQEGWDDAKVQALKNLPDAQRIEFIEGKILPLLTAGQKRVVEAKIFDNVNIAEEKSKALAAARTDAEKILAARKEEPIKARQAKAAEFATTLRPKLQKLPYVYFKEAPATATDAQKAEVEAHNAFAKELQEDLRRAISDESPEIRAEVVVAVPLARYLAREVKKLTARAEAAEGKLAAIAKASNTSRLGKSAAAPITPTAPSRGTDSSGNDAVDRLFAEASGQPVS